MKSLISSLLIACLYLFPSSSFGITIGFMVGSGGLGDESFNDMTWKGIGKARQECAFNFISRELKPGDSMEEKLKSMIDEGADVIICNGYQFLSLIQTFAPKYKDIWFIANDFNAGESPNIKSILYSQHEGAFLAGALAALQSKTGRVGFIGGLNIPAIKSFEVGYREGVDYISNGTTPVIIYLSTVPDYSGFNNPKKAFQTATTLYNDGVDIIFAVAGLSGNGVIQASKLQDRFVIGVDADQDHMARGHVLTSVMKRLDQGVYQEAVKACKDQRSPGISRYGIENGGISLTPMTYTSDIIGVKNREILQELEKQIITGEITVTDSLQVAE